MAEPLVLKTDKEPTIFNKEMVIGTLIWPVIGTVVGGLIGKNRMQEEKANGKVVTDKPSFWNKDTLLGGAIGYVLGGIGASLAFVATTGVTLATFAAGGAAAMSVAPATAAIGLAVAAGVALGSVGLGTYLGGRHGQARLSHEFEEAKQQKIVENISRTVSPEVGQAVAYTMEHNKQWGKQVLEEKLAAAGQANEQAR